MKRLASLFSSVGRGPGCWLRRNWLTGLACALAAVSGCSRLKPLAVTQEADFKSLLGGASRTPITPTELQGEVMRFADDYVGMVAQATEDASQELATQQARVMALRWKLDQATAAYINASSANPRVAMLEMIVLASVSLMVAEDYAASGKLGPAGPVIVNTHRQLESNAWGLVEGVLTSEQQAELRNLIEKWRQANPDVRHAGMVRFRDFAGSLAQMPAQAATKPNSIFSMLYLDPMAGLDPTTRAIEQTRELAARMMYYFERAPTLLRWQAELLTFEVSEQPAVEQVLTDAARLSKAADAIGGTAAQLPQIVNEQRQAAIAQLLAGLEVERSNIVAGISSQEPRLQALLGETRGTLIAGSEMANSLNAAIISLDAFVHYVSPPDTNKTTVVDTNSEPFNVLDYGKAATQVGAMAKELNVLLNSVNQSTAQIEKLGDEATIRGQKLLHRAFWLGTALIVLLLAGSLLTALVYRALTRRTPKAVGAGP